MENAWQRKKLLPNGDEYEYQKIKKKRFLWQIKKIKYKKSSQNAIKNNSKNMLNFLINLINKRNENVDFLF